MVTKYNREGRGTWIGTSLNPNDHSNSCQWHLNNAGPCKCKASSYKEEVPESPRSIRYDHASDSFKYLDGTTHEHAEKLTAAELRALRDGVEAAHDGAPLSTQKLDAGKAPAFQGLAAYFPLALMAVADVSAFGFQKYGEWGGWAKVADGASRYANALLRHFFARAGGEVFDAESKKRHMAQTAWNSLAVLELELRAAEKVT